MFRWLIWLVVMLVVVAAIVIWVAVQEWWLWRRDRRNDGAAS